MIGRAWIDGQEVPCGTWFGAPRWAFTCGVTAPEITWVLDPGLAAQVLSKNEVRIFLDYDNERVEIERVVVVGEQATGDPKTRAVTLSDVRWYWPNNHFRGAFNVRQPTGSRKLLAVDGTPTQVAAVADEIKFAPFSIRAESKAYTSDEIVAKVLDEIAGYGNWENKARRRTQHPNDVELDDPGHIALARALSLVGGVDVFVDRSGKVVVFDRILGTEKQTVEKHFPYALLNDGHLQWVRMNHIAPKKIVGLYSREMEVRFDFKENSPDSTAEDIRDTPGLENVTQITDQSLSISRYGVTSTEIQGSWVEVNSWFTAISSISPSPPTTTGPLTRAKVQDCFLGPLLPLMYVSGFTGVSPNMIWAGRVESILKNYRQTFRIDSRWLSRILPGSLRPVRAALLDGPTGTRQPSPVYMDYCQIPTYRLLAQQRADGKLAWNIHALPPDAGQDVGTTKTYTDPVDLSSCRPAPALVRMIDPRVGIFRIEMRLDNFDRAAQFVPSLLQELPTTDPEKVATLDALMTLDQAKLVRNHRMVVIMSCVPAGPNSDASLHRVEVSFDEALRALGAEAVTAQGGSRPEGRPLERRIYPVTLTARFAWSDEKRNEILGAFEEAKPFPTSLIPVNEAELKDHARSVAATAIAGMLDHYEGTASINGFPQIVPVGSIHTISVAFDGGGRAMTTVSAEPRPAALSPEHFMLDSTRRVIRREVSE